MGIVVNWDDFSSTLLARISVSKELFDYGWYTRYGLMLSGVNAAENGLGPKLDTLLFIAIDPVNATFAFYLLRDFALLAGLATVLIFHYRVPPPVGLAAAALACQGFNFLNWFFFGFDYFGPAFLFGYQFIPLLVLPGLLIQADSPPIKLILSFVASAAIGLLYCFSTVFAFSAFSVPIAMIWLALMVRSKAVLCPVAGIFMGMSIAVMPDVLTFLLHSGSVRHALWEPEELISIRKGLWLLLIRDYRLSALGFLLLVGALSLATKGKRMSGVYAFGFLYCLAMIPDPAVKTVLAQFEFVPPLLKSVNYYSYVSAPIFFCSALAVGFSGISGTMKWALSGGLILLAGSLAWAKVSTESSRPGMRLADVLADPVLEEVYQLTRNSSQRAAMVTADVRSLEFLRFRIPRPISLYLNSRQIPTSDGYASSMEYKYALLWSNILRPKDAPTASTPVLSRQAYLQVDVRDYVSPTADGCFRQSKAIPLSGINLDLLQLTATGYVVSFLDLDNRRLRLVTPRAPGPIVCGDGRMRSGFNIYKLDGAPKRFSIVRRVELVDDEQTALSRMRQSNADEGAEAVWLNASLVRDLSPENLVGGSGAVDVLIDGPDKVVVRVVTDAPTMLVVRDTFAPSAQASVGGRSVKILPANYVYMGVPIPSGESVVEIKY